MYTFFLELNWVKILDILMLSYLIYFTYQFLIEPYIYQLLKGIFVIIFLYIFSKYLHLKSLTAVLGYALQLAPIFLIIIFQSELKHFFLKLGRKSRLLSIKSTKIDKLTNQLKDTVYSLSEKKLGGLIILLGEVELNFLPNTGIFINGKWSKDLLESIFSKNSPLHDGACILKKQYILKAASILPTTKQEKLKRIFGTRHRAGLGISERSDALSIIISEQDGKVSIAEKGILKYDLEEKIFKKLIKKFLTKDKKIGENTFKKYWKKLTKKTTYWMNQFFMKSIGKK